MHGYWVCDACKSLNDPRHSVCYKCHVRRGEAKPQPIIPGATVGPALSETYGSGSWDTRKGPSILLAILFGTAVAVLLTGFWYWFEAGIHLVQGRAAWVVGLLIAFTVLVAGTLGGTRRVSFALPIISFLLALAAISVGEYLIISDSIAEASGLAVPGTIFLATADEVANAAAGYFAADPLRWILWFIALAEAWLIPWAALVGNESKGKTPNFGPF